MNNMKHTPGPWAVSELQTQDHEIIITQGGGITRNIACAYHEDSITTTEEEMANARLIAEAPSMRALLEDLREWIITGKVDGVGMDEAQIIEAIEHQLFEVEG